MVIQNVLCLRIRKLMKKNKTTQLKLLVNKQELEQIKKQCCCGKNRIGISPRNSIKYVCRSYRFHLYYKTYKRNIRLSKCCKHAYFFNQTNPELCSVGLRIYRWKNKSNIKAGKRIFEYLPKIHWKRKKLITRTVRQIVKQNIKKWFLYLGKRRHYHGKNNRISRQNKSYRKMDSW